MSEMIEVMIDSIRVSLTSQQRIILLRSLKEERYLPIWIGPYEAESITIALQEIELARPQTHDLVLQMMNKLGVHLRRIEITELKDDVFYGNLVVERENETINIDARPSDSIALAVRAHVPIFMAEDILTTAGVTPDPDLQQEPAETEKTAEDSQSATQPEPESTRKRLSVFEDFLQNLDIGDDQSTPGSDETGGDRPKPKKKE
jgi:bifunctional DNase/RNase